MYCGKCGNPDNKVITQNIEQDGDTITVSYFGVCEQCGESLGIKEFFHFTEWDYIDPEIVKNALLNFKGKGKLITRTRGR